MTLYADLVVTPDATPDEIKAAYRAKAKQHHPDVGGDKDIFTRIQHAYDVLMDPDERAYYDRHNAERPRDDLTAHAIQTIVAALDRLVQSNDVPDAIETFDVMGSLGMIVAEGVKLANEQLARTRRTMNRYTRLGGRFHKQKGEGENLFESITKHRIEELTRELASLEKTLATFTRAVEILADYDFERMMQLMAAGVDYAGQQSFTTVYRLG